MRNLKTDLYDSPVILIYDILIYCSFRTTTQRIYIRIVSLYANETETTECF